jgi:hypothetical protein
MENLKDLTIIENKDIEITNSVDVQNILSQYESNMMTFLQCCGLPSNNVLVDMRERKNVIRNITSPLELLDENKRSQSMYLSKFLAAVTSGLFDSALNYLWDETILQLRGRVAQYDIQYFFDVAVSSPERRSKLKDVEDLVKIDDSELIAAAKEIDLISDIGYKHLDYIKYMRNWASAAHPNQAQITGLNLIAWLETCINEVINLPASNVTIETRKLLKNIKSNKLTKEDSDKIGIFMLELPKEKLSALVNGFFGIYTRLATNESTRENINLLLPIVWEIVDVSVKCGFGIKYARFEANNDSEQAKLARYFLEIVDGQQYLPEPLRAAEIKAALENLKSAHHSFMDNFYKEPIHARQLKRLIGTHGVPKQVDYDYVITIIDAYLTNGNGECWDADTIYKELIDNLNQTQLIIAILCFETQSIASKLQFSLCQRKYGELIRLIESRITSPAVKELINEIKKYSGPLERMRDDSRMKKLLKTIKPLIS